MTGQVIIVTGGSSGIGFEVSKYLAEGGNDVVIACRSDEKGEEAVRKIKLLYPNALIQFMQLDLASLSSVREFAKEFMRRKRKLNVLINNAAMMLNCNDLTPRYTTDGLEVTMATNHLGPFLLINLLRDYMTQTAAIMDECRIINVTCSTHDHHASWFTRNLEYLDVDNFQLQNSGTFSGIQAYKNTKLCNILLTYRLAERLRGQKVTVNAVDPGYVPTTRLYRNMSRVKRIFHTVCFHYLLRCCHFTRTVRQAALQIVNLAISETYEGETGKFYRDGTEQRSSAESYDRDLWNAVWTTSSRLVHCPSTDANDDLDDISLGS